MNLILFKIINIYSYDIYHFEKLNNSKILVLVISICCFLIYFEETLHQLPTCIYTRCKFFRFLGGLLFLFVLFCLFVWFVFNDTLRSFFFTDGLCKIKVISHFSSRWQNPNPPFFANTSHFHTFFNLNGLWAGLNPEYGSKI